MHTSPLTALFVQSSVGNCSQWLFLASYVWGISRFLFWVGQRGNRCPQMPTDHPSAATPVEAMPPCTPLRSTLFVESSVGRCPQRSFSASYLRGIAHVRLFWWASEVTGLCPQMPTNHTPAATRVEAMPPAQTGVTPAE